MITMGKDFKKTLITILLLIGLGAALWYGLKWFGGIANDNAGDFDGGKSQYEQQVNGDAEG